MNNQIFFFFYNLAHQSKLFDYVVIFFAVYFPYLVIILAGLFLLFHHEVLLSQNVLQEFKKKYKEIVLVFITSGFAWVVAKILKTLIHTSRPFVEFYNVRALISENGYAFPSGHATLFMALAISIYFSHKKAGYVFMLFALLIGIARIIAGVHFPVDILGGFALGALVAYFLKNI